MKVLSTKILSDDLKKKLNKTPIQLTEFSFISISFLHNQQALDFLKSHAALPLVFTSRNGYLAYNNFGIRSSREAYCMSGSTEQLLQRNGLHVVGTGKDSADLADEILKNKPAAVVYLSGNLRSDVLLQKLTTAGVVVYEFIVYETTLTPLAVTEGFDAVLFFSPSAVRSFLQANTLPANTSAYCIGKTTTAELQNAGHTNIIFPQEPDAGIMIDLLIEQNTRF